MVRESVEWESVNNALDSMNCTLPNVVVTSTHVERVHQHPGLESDTIGPLQVGPAGLKQTCMIEVDTLNVDHQIGRDDVEDSDICRIMISAIIVMIK